MLKTQISNLSLTRVLLVKSYIFLGNAKITKKNLTI